MLAHGEEEHVHPIGRSAPLLGVDLDVEEAAPRVKIGDLGGETSHAAVELFLDVQRALDVFRVEAQESRVAPHEFRAGVDTHVEEGVRLAHDQLMLNGGPEILGAAQAFGERAVRRRQRVFVDVVSLAHRVGARQGVELQVEIGIGSASDAVLHERPPRHGALGTSIDVDDEHDLHGIVGLAHVDGGRGALVTPFPMESDEAGDHLRQRNDRHLAADGDVGFAEEGVLVERAPFHRDAGDQASRKHGQSEDDAIAHLLRDDRRAGVPPGIGELARGAARQSRRQAVAHPYAPQLDGLYPPVAVHLDLDGADDTTVQALERCGRRELRRLIGILLRSRARARLRGRRGLRNGAIAGQRRGASEARRQGHYQRRRPSWEVPRNHRPVDATRIPARKRTLLELEPPAHIRSQIAERRAGNVVDVIVAALHADARGQLPF
jgi:hypothetical protein